MKYFFFLICSFTISCALPNDDPSTGGQTGEEKIGCLPVKTNVIDRDTQSPLGFSADTLVSQLTLNGTSAMIWKDLPESTVEVKIKEVGAFEFVEYEWVNDSDQEIGPAIAPECSDLLEVPVEIQIKTADGFLNEKVQARLVASTEEKASVALNIQAADIQGSFDFSTYGPVADTNTWIEIEITAGGPSGIFEGTSVKKSENVVSAMRLKFGSW